MEYSLAAQFTSTAFLKPDFTWESELQSPHQSHYTLTFCLWLNAVCQINLCFTSLLLLLILDPSASLLSASSPVSSSLSSLSLPFSASSFPSLSCPFHTDAPSRPAWKEWWDVSTRYYTYPNIFTPQAGRLAGWERIFWHNISKKMGRVKLQAWLRLAICVFMVSDFKHQAIRGLFQKVGSSNF